MLIPDHAIETKLFWTWMDSNGICHTKTKKLAEIDIPEAKENTEAVYSFYIGKKFPLLIDAREVKSISREARQHFSTEGRETCTNAFGIIVKSSLSRVIGNFFMGINKPPLPTKLFDKEEDAVMWLLQFIEK